MSLSTRKLLRIRNLFREGRFICGMIVRPESCDICCETEFFNRSFDDIDSTHGYALNLCQTCDQLFKEEIYFAENTFTSHVMDIRYNILANMFFRTTTPIKGYL